jgi:hypothetical protein
MTTLAQTRRLARACRQAAFSGRVLDLPNQGSLLNLREHVADGRFGPVVKYDGRLFGYARVWFADCEEPTFYRTWPLLGDDAEGMVRQIVRTRGEV